MTANVPAIILGIKNLLPVDGVRAQRGRSHSNGAVARQVCCEVGLPNLCSLTCA